MVAVVVVVTTVAVVVVPGHTGDATTRELLGGGKNVEQTAYVSLTTGATMCGRNPDPTTATTTRSLGAPCG